MDSVWYKVILLGLLLMFILAPFAGFAPLLLVLLIAGIYWFSSSIAQVFVFGEQNETEYRENK